MKKIILAASVAMIASSSAFAADMAARPYTKAQPMAVPMYNWTGIYVGAHIGAAFGGDDGFASTFAGPLVSNSRDAAFLGGGQIGADYQFSPNWLIGIEGQISGLSDNDRTFTSGVNTFRDRSDWLASVTGRLGYVAGPVLIYGKGGVAFRDDSGLAATAGFLPAVTNRESTGYTVGGGLEYMFAPAWSAKIEYQYYNFDDTTVASAGIAPGVLSYKDDLHTVKVGVNYHFNSFSGGRY